MFNRKFSITGRQVLLDKPTGKRSSKD